MDLAQDLQDAVFGIVDDTRVHPHGLFQLRPDTQRGVERGGRVLGHVGDPRAPERPQLGGGQAQQVDAVHVDLARADAQPAAGMAEQREDDRRLSRPGLAHQAEHLAGLDGERNVTDHIGARPAEADLEVADVQPHAAGHRAGAGHYACSGPSSSTSAASSADGPRRSPPGHRIGERVRADGEQGDQYRGSDTAQGLSGKPTRFSLIIVPQFAVGGGWPNPRKASPAMITME